MCDAGDIIDVGAGIATGGVSYAFSKATGDDLPAVKIAKGLVQGTPTPKPPDLPPLPPPPVDPTAQIVQRAMAAERLRSARSSGFGFQPTTIGPAPIALPKARGY